jgi:hypothetical protein
MLKNVSALSKIICSGGAAVQHKPLNVELYSFDETNVYIALRFWRKRISHCGSLVRDVTAYRDMTIRLSGPT